MMEITDEVIERRKDFRIDMEEELVDIEWTDSSGNINNERIQCIDFSKGGLKIQFNQDLPVNALATFTFQKAHPNSQILKAQVIRSIKHEAGDFHVALRMVD